MSSTPSHHEPSQNRPALNPAYTFAEFVVGPTNILAFETCKDLGRAIDQEEKFSIFLYGASGMGKTHLLHAVGNAYLALTPKKRIIYTTAGQLLAEHLLAHISKRLDEFEAEYLNLDLLLVDNMESFAAKTTHFGEFFYFLDHIVLNAKKTIFASNRFPAEIPDMNIFLTYHITRGVKIEIKPPEFENRVDILLRASKAKDFMLPLPCALFMAYQIQASAPELERELGKVIAVVNSHSAKLSIDLINEVIQPYFSRLDFTTGVRPRLSDLRYTAANTYST